MTSLWKPTHIISVPHWNKIWLRIITIFFSWYTQDCCARQRLVCFELPAVHAEHNGICICYIAFHVNKQVNTKIFNGKNVQHYIYVLDLRTWSCASRLQCLWKIFSTESIYCEYVLYVVRKIKVTLYQCFQTNLHQRYLYALWRAKFKLLFTVL